MRIQGSVRRVFFAWVCVVGACSSDELPQGWGNATPVKNLVQAVCAGSMEFSNEHASFTGGSGSIGVDYQEAHFRCEQDVYGVFKVGNAAVEILVQPIDMHPEAVAGCDCGYNITFLVEPVPSGTMQTTLYRRWDALNSPNDPVPIASAPVVVQ
jgi:hypothetical protein